MSGASIHEFYIIAGGSSSTYARSLRWHDGIPANTSSPRHVVNRRRTDDIQQEAVQSIISCSISPSYIPRYLGMPYTLGNID